MNITFKSVIAASFITGLSLSTLADGQVYTFTATLKSTVVAKSKSRGSNGLYYRKQGSIKLQGVFWGCGIETLANPAIIPEDYEEPQRGYVFWTSNAATCNQEFQWSVLNRTDTNAQKCEGAWSLYDEDWGIELIGSGFGTAKGVGDASVISAMSGSCVGTIHVESPDVYAEQGCTFCAYEDSPLPCWDIFGYESSSYAGVVSGTWTIKYDSKASKSYSSSADIFRAYKFPSLVQTSYRMCLDTDEAEWNEY